MSEPPQKRLKTATDKMVDFVFGDDADRFLLIDGKLFHVQSNKLIRHSEYFRALFTSGFSEKNQKEIQLKEIDADDAILFLTALFERDTFDVRNVNLECLIKTSNYFQANEYLVGLFEENPILWLENLSSEKILALTVDYGILELKDAVEKSLIVDFNQRLKLKKIVRDSKYIDESIATCLRLITEYGLVTMKSVVDNHLADYYREKRFSYFCEVPWISLIQEHHLNHLKEAMEEFAIVLFKKDPSESILRRYGDAINSLPLNKLKAYAEELFVVEMKKRPCDMFECLELFEMGDKYNMDSLKTSVEDYMRLNGLEEEGRFMDNWNYIFYEHYPFGRHYQESKERIISDINLIIESLLNKGLNRIKEKLEDILIAEFNKITALKKRKRDELTIDLVSLAKHLPRYKIIVESCCTKLFRRKKNKMEYEKYRHALNQYDEFNLDNLVAVVNAHLLSEYEKPKADRQLKFDDSSFVSLAFEFNFTDLMDCIQNNYVAQFESDEYRLKSMVDLMDKYKMPILKESVEKYLIDKVESGDVDMDFIKKYQQPLELPLDKLKDAIETYLVDHFKATRDFKYIQFDDVYPKFKDAIEEYLIDHFEATRDFKRAEFAFTRGYPKFKDVLTAFLSTTNDPVMQANRDHILKLSESDQNYIFRLYLFREK